MSERFRRLFAAPRPVIAMAHVPALPGSPLYHAAAGVAGAIDAVRRDLEILVDEGVDGVLFCNGDHRPYLNTGARAGNIAAFAPFIDGVIVGSELKRGGGTWNPVERERVRRYLDAARGA